MVIVNNQSSKSKHMFRRRKKLINYVYSLILDMNYGPSGAYNTPTNSALNSGSDYYPSYHSHYQPHMKNYSNGLLYDSLKANNSVNRFDDHDDELQLQQQSMQQQIETDYDLTNADRPKLLMWGLTKYIKYP